MKQETPQAIKAEQDYTRAVIAKRDQLREENAALVSDFRVYQDDNDALCKELAELRERNVALVAAENSLAQELTRTKKPTLTKTRIGNYLRRHPMGDISAFRQGFKEGVRFAGVGQEIDNMIFGLE